LAVGQQLFYRSSGGALLTRVGSELLPRSRLILDEVGHLASDVHHLQRTSLSFGLTPLAILLLLDPALAQFRKTSPDVQLRLVDGLLSNVIPRLREGNLDFAFVAATPHALPSDLRFDPCFNGENAVFVNDDHPLVGRPCTLDDLLGYAWIQNEARSGIYGRLMEWLMSQNRLPPRTIFCESLATSVAVVSATDAIGYGPNLLLSHSMFRNLRELAPGFELPRATFGFLTYGNAIPSKPSLLMQSLIRTASATLSDVIHL
jgi:DNA-binding transcriptional LysR family regulator